jgi:3-oxoacyl-[acyl-carrier protein] reductase
MSDTNSRVALVTGGSRGIGRAVAERLSADGFAVVIGYGDGRAAAQAAVDAITTSGGRALAVSADVADEHAVAAMFAVAHTSFGGVDVVVNAAGRMSLAPLADLNLDDFDALHRTNVRGTFVVAQQATRQLRPGGALILFSTSIIGRPLPGYGAYAASKGAVEALTSVLAKEFRGRDLTVNAVAPGPTATALFLQGKDDQLLARLAAEPPMERLGTPEDIAGVVAFLAGPDARWVHGQVLRPNGGLV